MDGSPIVEDYPQYRLLDGEVVEVMAHYGNIADVKRLRDKQRIDVSPHYLEKPTRLQLQCAGDDDSPGGLLDEDDIREGDFVVDGTGLVRTVKMYDSRAGEDSLLLERNDQKGRWWKKDVKLATPSELREAGVEPPEGDDKKCADDLPDGDWVMITGYDPPRGPYLAVSHDHYKGYRLIDQNGEPQGGHHDVRLVTPVELREAGIEPPEASDASTPEPPPERGDRDVPEPLISFLEDQGYDGAADLVRKRVRFGVEKYGTRLETGNGRDPIEDARQEIGDALQYLAQAKMEGRNVRELNDLILGALLAVLGEYSG